MIDELERKVVIIRRGQANGTRSNTVCFPSSFISMNWKGEPSQGVLVAIGISAAGYREVLGCWVAESESEGSWGAVFSELKQRT